MFALVVDDVRVERAGGGYPRREGDALPLLGGRADNRTADAEQLVEVRRLLVRSARYLDLEKPDVDVSAHGERVAVRKRYDALRPVLPDSQRPHGSHVTKYHLRAALGHDAARHRAARRERDGAAALQNQIACAGEALVDRHVLAVRVDCEAVRPDGGRVEPRYYRSRRGLGLERSAVGDKVRGGSGISLANGRRQQRSARQVEGRIGA